LIKYFSFSDVTLFHVSVKASPGLFKLHQGEYCVHIIPYPPFLTPALYCAGAKVRAESDGAELRRSVKVTEARSVEVRVRSRLPARFKQPDLSVEGKVLEAAAGGRGRFSFKVPAGNSNIVINQWTKGANARVYMYYNELRKRILSHGTYAQSTYLVI
jgi:hypothetical protein